MFVSEDLVFVELHKTACTHIGKWLSRLLPGEQIGKHNRVPESLRDRFVLGSIRNPWDWYVSLWAYGCSRRGSVYLHTTGGHGPGYGYTRLPSEMGMRFPIAAIATQTLRDRKIPTREWQDVYLDANDAGQFRRWLQLIFDPAHRFDIGEGYAFSNVSTGAGLLTYRFLKLFTSLDDALYAPRLPSDPAGLRDAWERHRITRFEIRTERLEADLLAALETAGIDIAPEAAAEIEAGSRKRTNVSSRLPVEHYYDATTSDLVGRRERLIVEQYGYSPPASDSIAPVDPARQ